MGSEESGQRGRQFRGTLSNWLPVDKWGSVLGLRTKLKRIKVEVFIFPSLLSGWLRGPPPPHTPNEVAIKKPPGPKTEVSGVTKETAGCLRNGQREKVCSKRREMGHKRCLIPFLDISFTIKNLK